MVNVGSAGIGDDGIITSFFNVGEGGISLPVGGAMTLAGLTQFVYTGTVSTTTISVQDTYYQITCTTATKGAVTGSLTDNNDGSWTNDSGETKRIHGIISGAGGNGTVVSFNIGVGTDNSGSLAVEVDDFGNEQRYGSIAEGFIIYYSLDLDNGKFVAPIVQNRSSAANFAAYNLSHYVWSYD